MLKYLDMEEKGRSRDLWEEAFPEDSKAFDDYYFSEKLKDNRILAIEEGGRIQSMVQLNPYLLQVKARRWRVDYLVGVATRKDKRHQGYMRRLLLQMMSDMKAEKMPFCFLMPADEAIYRPFGFTYIFRQPEWSLKAGLSLERRALNPLASTDVKHFGTEQQRIAQAAAWMNDWLARRYQVFAVRDKAYLLRLLDEVASEDGTLELLYDGAEGRMVGLQSFWGLHEREQRLLYVEDAYVQAAAGEAKPAIMARIISLDAFLRVIHLKESAKQEELTIRLWLDDPLIAENHGLWIWHLNHEASWVEPGADLRQEDQQDAWQDARQDAQPVHAQADLCLTIDELTAWLFGYQVPKAAESWDPLIETLRDVFLDEVV
ncbi:MAG: GNAT family N-acetyltransferase [Lachnospiraceae bacterium]|nr:GNAT family N-acetyltransferase [Lachnospiraceae bacterium]